MVETSVAAPTRTVMTHDEALAWLVARAEGHSGTSWGVASRTYEMTRVLMEQVADTLMSSMIRKRWLSNPQRIELQNAAVIRALPIGAASRGHVLDGIWVAGIVDDVMLARLLPCLVRRQGVVVESGY
jgi:hypothetical protein